MAIVKMRKLQLVAMSYDEDCILDAMQKTGAVEIRLNPERNVPPSKQTEALTSYCAMVETALDSLCNAVGQKQKEEKEKSDLLEDGFEVSFSDFFAVKEQKAEMDETVEKIHALLDEKSVLSAELAKIRREKEQVKPYAHLEKPFSYFQNTAHTQGRLGILPAQAKENLKTLLEEKTLCAYEILYADTENILVFITYHKTVAMEMNGILSSLSFQENVFEKEKTGKELYLELEKKERLFLEKISQNGHTVYGLRDKIRSLKVYCDYLRFALEKENVSSNVDGTERTIFLQAYVPEEAEKGVEEAIRTVSSVAYMEFSDPTEEEEVPTLLKNNSIVSNFESITNTFSVPHYREFDPNAVMAFFYSLFMGFIIGDAGYGFLMAGVGGWLWWKNREKPTGVSKMAGAFAAGGVFAVFWGLLFNSLFGFMILPITVMPNPQTDMWLLAGIAVPSVLIISMILGIFQIFVGYLCKAVQEWRRGNIGDGICDGVVWSIFSIGVALAIVGFVEEANVPILATIGACIAGGSLLLAMILAGRKEKFFGKFAKGFGAVYGIINYASDVLSYARLYGLMLSGAVIAQIIATYSGQFIVSGNIALLILGVVLLIVGHGFNLVMNLLGAYIHDSRLQYVEFYGRFYEGDGTEFAPIGSAHKYISLTSK